MKKHQKYWQHLLSWASFLGLLVNIIFPAGLVLAEAAPIGNLRTWENVITASSAELHFSFSAAGYFRIDYGTASGTYPLSSVQITLTNTSYPYYYIIIRDLTPNTTYYYRLASKALSPSTAEWGYTTESSFTTTAADTTPPAASAIAASEVTSSSANITFTLSEAGYAKIEYGLSGNFGSATSEISAAASAPTTIPLSSLTAGSSYNYRVVARDSAGNSATSGSYTFITTPPPDTTPPTISGISSAGVTTSSVSIYFSLNEAGYAKVEYGPNNTFTLSTTELSVPASASSIITLSGLTAGTTYSYRLVARDSNNNSTTSGSYSFTTTSSGTTSSGCTGLTLTLNKSSYTVGENVNYTYTCTPSGTVANSVTVQLLKPDQTVTTYNSATNVSTSSLGFSTSNLTAGTYTLRACFDPNCLPTPTVSATFTMTSGTASDTTPPTISGISSAGVTTSSVSIYFSLNEAGYAKVEYGPNNTFTLSTTELSVPASASSIITLSGLTAGTTYSYRLVARDSNNNSTTSGSYSFTTTSVTSTQTSPIGWWKFDGNGANEVAGGPSALSVGSATFYPSGGAAGGYGYVPSSSDYFRIPYSSVFDLPDSFTVEFWFRQRANKSFNQNLVYKGSPPNNYNFSIFRYLWDEYNNGTVIAGHTASGTSYWTQASNPNEPPHNSWHHVAYTKSSSGQAYYIDGVLIHSKDFSQYPEYAGSAKTPAVDIIIGDSAVDTDFDNLKIYNRTLSASEVSQSAGSSTLPPGDTTPPTISGIYASNTMATSTLVYFTSSEAGYAKVEYGPNYTYTFSSPEVSVTAGTSATTILYGLTAGTNYSYRIVARDSANNSATSGSFTFTTNTGPTTNAVPVVSGVGTKWTYATSAQLYWSCDQSCYGQVEYGTSPSYSGSSYTPWTTTLLISPAVDLTGLTANTTYYVRVYAKNTGGVVSTGMPFSFTTPTSTTAPPTGDTTAPVISGAHIMTNTAAYTQIMWSTDDQSYGKVDYGETTAYNQFTNWSTNLSYSPAVDITGLSAGKTYHYRVRAKNAAGLESVSTTDYTFVAGGSGEPITATAFTVDFSRTYPQTGSYSVPVSTPKIQVEFTKPIDPASAIGSSVYLGFLGSATTTSLPGKLDVFGNGFNFIFSDPLKAGVSYNFIVRGTIRATSGESLGSDYTLTFTTAKVTETTGQGIIKGIIKDSTGKSVAGAHVAIWSANYGFGQKGETTTYGEYAFANLAAGTYTVEVYPPSGAGGFTRPAPATVTLQSGETAIRDFTFATSNATIKGLVKFSDGTPVTDAEVSAYRREGSGWVSSPVTPDGSYSLAVQVGAWMVSIRPKYLPYATTSYSPIIGTGSNWVYTQPPQEVYIATDNDTRQIDFIVPKQTSNTSISGSLQRSDGESLPASSAKVSLIGQGGIAVSTSIISGGRFTTPIAPGTYKLYINMTDSDLSSPEVPPVTIFPGEQKDIGVIMIPVAIAKIFGRVTTLDGKGVPRIKVAGWKANSADSASAVTDEQGNYSLKVSPGDWNIGIAGSLDQIYSSTVPPQFVRVLPGVKVPPVNFVLATSDGVITGTVRGLSGEILPDFYGFVSVTSRSGGQLNIGAPVERGQFTLRLPAGSYLLQLEFPANATYSRSTPVPVTVDSGEQLTVTLTVKEVESGVIIGYLVDRDGNKVVNVPFKVFATGSGGGWYSALIDTALGYYKLRVPPGTWYVDYDVADNSGQYKRPWERKKKVTVGSGQIVTLDLAVIEQNGRINGTVRDTEGNSVPNVWVAVSSRPFSKFGREAVGQRYLNGLTADENGEFSLPVPPGTYYVRAFVPPSLGLANPEEQSVKVAAGEEANVGLVLRSIATTISGRTTIAGIPSWAFVWAWSDKGGYTESESDEKGNYKLKVAANDVWHVSAMSELNRDTYKASEVALAIGLIGGNIPLSLDLAPLGVKLPDLVTVGSEADQMAVATNDAGARLVVPANAASTEEALSVSITPEVITPSQGSEKVIGFGYEMGVRTAAGQEINSFNSELTVSIPYDPKELTRLNLRPADLSLRYWDEVSSTWREVMNAIVDEISHVITGSLAHLTRFAIIASTDTTPPAAPASLKAKVAADGVVLSWVKPKDKDLQYVKIYRSTTKGALGEVAANNVKAATYKDSGLKRGATYYYLARAVDAAGNESTNAAAVAVGVKGKGTLGKAASRSATVKAEKLTLKGSITDVNLVASTIEIKDSRGKKVVAKFAPKTTFKKDGKAVKAGEVKVGNTINAQATREGGVITLVSAVVTSVKVKVKAELKVSQFAGQRSKLKVKIIEARGVVAGVGIEKGKEALLNIEGATVNTNGKSTPVESLSPQKNVTIEGVVENGAVTVIKITTPPPPKVKVQPKSQGRVGDQAASVAR